MVTFQGAHVVGVTTGGGFTSVGGGQGAPGTAAGCGLPRGGTPVPGELRGDLGAAPGTRGAAKSHLEPRCWPPALWSICFMLWVFACVRGQRSEAAPSPRLQDRAVGPHAATAGAAILEEGFGVN